MSQFQSPLRHVKQEYESAQQLQESTTQYTPQQPSPKTSLKKYRVFFAELTGLIVIVFIAGIGISIFTSSRGSQAKQHVLTASRPFIINKTQNQSIVGKPFVINNTWVLMISSISTSHGGNIDTPSAGTIYLLIEITLNNRSSKIQTASHTLMFDFRDSTGRQYASQSTGFGAQPDGKVPSEGSLHGLLVYEVPTAQHQFMLKFRPDTSTTSWTEWSVTI